MRTSIYDTLVEVFHSLFLAGAREPRPALCAAFASQQSTVKGEKIGIMVFAVLSSALTSLVAYAFPSYASYKAIKANDTSQMTPWLMYWSVLACLSFFEHWCYFFLQWYVLVQPLIRYEADGY